MDEIPVLLLTQAEEHRPNAETILQLRYQVLSPSVQGIFRIYTLVDECSTAFAPGSFFVSFFRVFTPGRPLLLGERFFNSCRHHWVLSCHCHRFVLGPSPGI